MCLEGDISKSSVMTSLSRGKRASGDLIPWTVSQQFNDHDFAGLPGGRIVRIATHPDFQGVWPRGSDLESFETRNVVVEFFWRTIFKKLCSLFSFVLDYGNVHL